MRYLLPSFFCIVLSAAAQTSITSCGSYSGTGDYVLNASLLAPDNSICIEFTGDSFTLKNGASYTITANGAGQSTAIQATGQTHSFSITGMILSAGGDAGFGIAVVGWAPADSTQKAIVANNRVSVSTPFTAPPVAFVAVGSGAGIQVTTNRFDMELALVSTTGVVVSGNSISVAPSALSSGIAVDLNGNTGVQFISNTVYSGALASLPSYGVQIWNDANGLVANNTIAGFSLCGIRMIGSDTGTRISTNNISGITGTTVPGICDSLGAALSTSLSNSYIVSNTVTGQLGYGLKFTDWTTFTGNTISGNTFGGSVKPVQWELSALTPVSSFARNSYGQNRHFALSSSGFQSGPGAAPDFCGVLADCGASVHQMIADGGGNSCIPSSQINYPVTCTQTGVPAPSVTGPAALPPTVVGDPYPATQATATGGVPPYAWSATGLVSGLSINASTGVISGTPSTNSGSPYSVKISVTDTASASASATLPLVVNATLKMTLPVTNVFQPGPVSYLPSASGGSGGNVWSASSLPSWLSINSSTGAVTGTAPSNSQQLEISYLFSITVTDSAMDTVTLSTSILVAQSTAVSVISSCPGDSAPLDNNLLTYALSGDISSNNADCLTITVPPCSESHKQGCVPSPLVLDCQGHSIDTSGIAASGQFTGGRPNPVKVLNSVGGLGVTIQNCTILGGDAAARLGQPSDAPKLYIVNAPNGVRVIGSTFGTRGSTYKNGAITVQGAGSFAFSNSTIYGNIGIAGVPSLSVQNSAIYGGESQGAAGLTGNLAISPDLNGVVLTSGQITGTTIAKQCNDGHGVFNQPTCYPTNSNPTVGFGDSNLVLSTVSGLLIDRLNVLVASAGSDVFEIVGKTDSLTIQNSTINGWPAFVTDTNLVGISSARTVFGSHERDSLDLSNSLIANNTVTGAFQNLFEIFGNSSTGNAFAHGTTGLFKNNVFQNNTFTLLQNPADLITNLLGNFQIFEHYFQCQGPNCTLSGATGTAVLMPYGSNNVFSNNVFQTVSPGHPNADSVVPLCEAIPGAGTSFQCRNDLSSVIKSTAPANTCDPNVFTYNEFHANFGTFSRYPLTCQQ